MASSTIARRLGLTGNRGCKAPVRAATSANITLSGEQTTGGVALVDRDRCLVWQQTDGTQNGIYDVSTGAWTRSIDADGTQDWSTGTIGIITAGTYIDQFWFLTTTGSIVPGTTSLAFQVGIPQLPVLAAQTGAGLIGFISALAGAIPTTVQAEMRTRLTVTQFGADPTGATDSSAAVAAAIAAMPNPCALVFPYGTYRLNSGISVPYAGVNGSGKTLIFEGCTLQAGADNVKLLHWSDSRGSAIGSVKFTTGGYAGVSGFRLSPTNEASTTVLENQNFNKFGAEMEFIGLAEGIVTQTGPRVLGADSGCYFNMFSGGLVFGSCDRCIWFRDGSLGPNSGQNSNMFTGGISLNGSINTGIEIDAGGGNLFIAPRFENITNGATPNATPIALYVSDTMANGNANPDNTFINPHWENCTINATINNPDTRIVNVSDSDLLNSNGQITAFTDQYRQAVPSKGNMVNSILNTVTSVTTIRGLWLFDEYGASSEIVDRSTKGHSLFLRDASLVAQAARLWGPRISGEAFCLTYGDESHLWDVASHADFNFGDGATDSAFSIVTLIYPTLASSCEIVSKDDITTASTKRQYATSVETNGSMSFFLFDDSAGAYIARTAPGGSITANAVHLVTTTYDGAGLAAGMKIYVDSSQVDNTTLTAGVYTAMEAKTAKVAGYRTSTAGVPERFFKGRLFLTMIIGAELTASQVRQLSYLLRSYAGAALS